MRAAAIQPLHKTGHRLVGEGMDTVEHHRQEAAMPSKDANANKTYFGPAGLLKGSASGRHKTSLDVSRPQVAQSAGRFQRARSKRK